MAEWKLRYKEVKYQIASILFILKRQIPNYKLQTKHNEQNTNPKGHFDKLNAYRAGELS